VRSAALRRASPVGSRGTACRESAGSGAPRAAGVRLTLTCAAAHISLVSPCLQEEPKSDYENQRLQRMDENARTLSLLDSVKVGQLVHIPHSVFPDEDAPPRGYWMGKICKTKKGGTGDVGIHIEGEEIFTRSRLEVVKWLPAEEEPPEPSPEAAPQVMPGTIRLPAARPCGYAHCCVTRCVTRRVTRRVTLCVTLCVTRVWQVMEVTEEEA
jgi:hypothetical protein